MFKKILIITCIFTLIFTGCGNKGGQSTGSDASQMNPPVKGDTVGVLKTSMGDIKFKLFPEEAPKAVENFKKLAEKGYYDNLIFHRIISDFMIQGGDPEGTGRGGESIWGKPFNDEIGKNLHHFRGALAMANSGPNTNGSQFFIVQKKEISTDDVKSMEQNKFNSKLIEQYKKFGGAEWLEKDFAMPNGYVSTGYTIFGQVYEGMEIVDKIAGVEVDENTKPTQDVKMLGIEISKVE
jgi:peptidyl-prolyl cis-trans isomerase B (cyclophilin B)